MTVSAAINLSLGVQLKGSNAFAGGPLWNASMGVVQSFEDGIVANKVNLAYMAERTVNASSNDDIDLAGVLTDALGATFAAAELVAILIRNKPLSGDNTTNLTLSVPTNGAPLLTGTTPALAAIRPGGFFMFCNPDANGIMTVTPGTGDLLRIANAAGAQNKYQIGLLARNA